MHDTFMFIVLFIKYFGLLFNLAVPPVSRLQGQIPSPEIQKIPKPSEYVADFPLINNK